MPDSLTPKLKITPNSEVLASSDKRTCRNVAFHDGLTGQGSSFCNRARLNFQAFALRDMKMAVASVERFVCPFKSLC